MNGVNAMKTMLIAVALVVSGAALAGPQQGQPAPQGDQGWQQRGWAAEGEGPRRDSPEHRQMREQRKRMMQVVGLTEALGLSTQDALKLDETIRRFDERRRPLKDSVRESAKVVMDAARGDNAALAQVDQATNRILDARIQLATLDKEMFQALSAGMNAQQRAKLALFYARFHKGMKAEGRHFRMMRMHHGPQRGEADAPPSDLGAVAADADNDDDVSL